MSLLEFLVVVGLVIFGGTALYLAVRIAEAYQTLFRFRRRLKELDSNGKENH